MTRSSSAVHAYDVCIVGAGPAGLTIASELAFTGKKICVVESGGISRTDAADALREVGSPSLSIKPASRERIVGGASSVWGGLSALLDDVDFLKRPWTEGWPMPRRELEPYLMKAEKYRFPSHRDFQQVQNVWPGLAKLTNKLFVAVRPAFNFARLSAIFERENVTLLTETTLLRLNSEEGKVTDALCVSKTGEEVRIEAGIFVLAAGGIENPRILLHSKLGNQHDQVGRCFMNHPKGYACTLRLSERLPIESFYLPRTIHGRMMYAAIRLSEDFQKKNDLLNSCIQFEPNLGIFQRYAFAIWKRLPRLTARVLDFLRPKVLKIRWFADMEPRGENRVTLSETPDAFGVPRAVVDYSLGPRDTHTLTVLYEELKNNVERLGLGTLSGEASDVLKAVRDDASHHLGGTRMGNDPRTSVVDAHCKVHTLDNLYIAGGSVFPTAGCASPTYTIVALAIRLAEHLKVVLGEDREEDRSKTHGDKVVIIGAGNRVQGDVVPAIESRGELSIQSIFARHSSMVVGRVRRYEVRKMETMRESDFNGVRFVYISVPRESVREVMEGLPQSARSCELIIDTPIVSKDIVRLGRKFRRVHVAEDSVFLPWISAFQKRGDIAQITFDRSVYRYHGIALAKALAGGPVRWGIRIGNKLYMKVGEARVSVVEPRDYNAGKIFINGSEVRDVVRTMHQLKREGLERLLAAAVRGEKTWSLEEGLNDARVDSILHRFWLYFSLS